MNLSISQPRPATPAVCDKLTKVNTNSNAFRGGITTDSLLEQRGEWKSWAGYIPMIISEKPFTAHYIDPDGNPNQADLDAGLLGVSAKGEYRLDLAYLRRDVGVQDPRWDRQLVVACHVHRTDPALAETALHYAINLGYQEDALTDLFQIMFRTFTKEGPESAMESFFGRFENEEDIPWVLIPPLQNALTVCGRIDFMERIEKIAGDNAVFTRPILDDFLNWTGNEKKLGKESLLKRAIAARGESLKDNFEPYKKGKPLKDGPEITEDLKFSPRPGHYYYVEHRQKELVKNLHYQAEIELAANGLTPRWSTQLRICFLNQYSEDHPAPKTTRFPKSGISYPGRNLYLAMGRSIDGTKITTSGSEMPGIRFAVTDCIEIPFVANPDVHEDIREEFEKTKGNPGENPSPVKVDMIRMGSELGIFVNDICLLHLPADPNTTTPFAIHIHGVGVSAEIRKAKVWKLAQ